MLSNVVQALQYLDSHLPNGSHVILTGLVDGRFLWDNLHDRYHPLGKYEVLWGPPGYLPGHVAFTPWIIYESIDNFKQTWQGGGGLRNMRLCSNSRRASLLSAVQDRAGRGQTPNLPALPAPNWNLSAPNQDQHLLWMCKHADIPQPWPKIVASLPALHSCCCYRCSWTFGEHLHSLIDGCLGKTGCGLGLKIKSGGGKRLVRY